MFKFVLTHTVAYNHNGLKLLVKAKLTFKFSLANNESLASFL